MWAHLFSSCMRVGAHYYYFRSGNATGMLTTVLLSAHFWCSWCSVHARAPFSWRTFDICSLYTYTKYFTDVCFRGYFLISLCLTVQQMWSILPLAEHWCSATSCHDSWCVFSADFAKWSHHSEYDFCGALKVILGLRLYAMYGSSKRILALLAVLFTAEITMMGVIFGVPKAGEVGQLQCCTYHRLIRCNPFSSFN